jgi:hypothetical protein
MVIEGLGVAPSFRFAIMAAEMIVAEQKRSRLTVRETRRLTDVIHANDQAYKNGTAPRLLASVLSSRIEVIAPELMPRLEEFAFVRHAVH